TYEATGDSEKLTVNGISADGSRVTWGYTVRFDGKYYPITGSGPGGADAIAVKRINARTVEATLQKEGKAFQTANRVVSQDGKTMTATARTAGANGPPAVKPRAAASENALCGIGEGIKFKGPTLRTRREGWGTRKIKG
ncbi:MAG: hypothetical protein LAN59_03550, partial [Acidobacteriia bacterium]|nr:hypothetical protein [Terriglobia bacterium]